MNNIIIEHLSPPSDSNRLNKILEKLDKTFIPILSERVNINEYAQKLARSAEIFYVIKDGQDIGNCAVYLNETNGFISSIAIKPEYTRMHLGETLWKAVRKLAISKKIYTITLKVYEYNHNAYFFYKQIGFSVLSKENKWIIMQINERNNT